MHLSQSTCQAKKAKLHCNKLWRGDIWKLSVSYLLWRGDIWKLSVSYLPTGAAVDKADKNGWTPLIAAAYHDQLSIVKVLLNHKASVDGADRAIPETIISPPNYAHQGGKTALLHATERGHLDIVKGLLLRGAAVDAQNQDDWTPLIMASWHGYLDIIKLLLDHGAAVNGSTKANNFALSRA
ncbi:hypothetical protein AC1031_014021 [Aphanomyces cochlioides]|nr:hypothetical protein AC1031_014021 [Aphanomyces cochlioides]